MTSATSVLAQVPRPTMNIVGSYFYDSRDDTLHIPNQFLNDTIVTSVQYLDGTTSSTDAISGAAFSITGMALTGFDGATGDAFFTNGTITVSNGTTTFLTADLVNVRMTEFGFGDFGNFNVGFEETNVTNLVFGIGTGSRFVDEFAALIAPAGVPNEAKAQLALRLLFAFGVTEEELENMTFAEKLDIISAGSVVGVFDGAPTCLTAPTITGYDGTPLVVPINSNSCLTGYFNDLDLDDSHTATWDYGDGNASEVVVFTPNPATACHQYAEPGIYTATLTITDECDNTDTQSIVIVAYDPTSGFTTGGGWFVPDAQSFIDGNYVTDVTSKANFGFIVKYKKEADTPDGSLEFRYKAGDIDLHSTDMEWLVIQSDKDIRFKGQATVNGNGPYTFKVSGRDNGEPGYADEFKIEIWLGVTDTENGPPTPKHMAKGILGGGNIKIHK